MTARQADAKTQGHFSIFHRLFIRFVCEKEASCCYGRTVYAAGGGSGCRILDMKEFQAIWLLPSALCQGLLAGQVLPLGCKH